MDALRLFGLLPFRNAGCYAFESRSHWFVLLFAGSCVLGSAYGFLQDAWPFGLVEAVWSLVALRRWLLVRKSCRPCENSRQGRKTSRRKAGFRQIFRALIDRRPRKLGRSSGPRISPPSFRTVCLIYAHALLVSTRVRSIPTLHRRMRRSAKGSRHRSQLAFEGRIERVDDLRIRAHQFSRLPRLALSRSAPKSLASASLMRALIVPAQPPHFAAQPSDA